MQEKVRRNDTWSLLSSAAGASPRSREMVWEFVKENWALFDERYKDNILLERIVQVQPMTYVPYMYKYMYIV